MAQMSTLERAISDLRKIPAFCNRENLDDVPDLGLRYLKANISSLEFYLTQVYRKTTEEERRALCEAHRELDYSVISEEFQEIASSPIRQAKEQSISGIPTGELLDSVSYDDLKMLIRVLEYARYCPLDPDTYHLDLSPIDQYGLKNYLDPPVLLSVESLQVVRWDVSDALYAEAKVKAFV